MFPRTGGVLHRSSECCWSDRLDECCFLQLCLVSLALCFQVALLQHGTIRLLLTQAEALMTQQVLEAAVCSEAGLREKAIRLTGNRLFPDTNLQATILSHARASLHTLHKGVPVSSLPRETLRV